MSELVEKTYRLAQLGYSKNNWLIIFSKKVSGNKARLIQVLVSNQIISVIVKNQSHVDKIKLQKEDINSLYYP